MPPPPKKKWKIYFNKEFIKERSIIPFNNLQEFRLCNDETISYLLKIWRKKNQ